MQMQHRPRHQIHQMLHRWPCLKSVPSRFRVEAVLLHLLAPVRFRVALDLPTTLHLTPAARQTTRRKARQPDAPSRPRVLLDRRAPASASAPPFPPLELP